FQLHVRRGGAPPMEEPPARPVAAAAGPAPAPAAPPAAAPPAAPATGANGASPHDGAAAIEAPMLGTFYRASSPGDTPFVEVGAKVEADTVVCLIEVMKMMNSIKAGVAGTVVEVCADNAELVEYGQPLFRVVPDA
ncbi:MAG: acetyl-CoA carboxylase biotin carboxyl carrier protein, partial [Solirubrobacteraceae bacterium]|nr:acetyl-CoA carboxylase biotin carboxyl carrier protein [Solirubrobacteraceae bacterium]